LSTPSLADIASLNNLAWTLAEVRKKPDEAMPLATKPDQPAPASPEVLSAGFNPAWPEREDRQPDQATRGI